MAGFGGEMLFFAGLAYVVLGPQRMRTALQHLARMKQEFEKTQRELSGQLDCALHAEPKDPQA